jgi:ABC-type nitrate/sulfonate/bicarbonate transport system ATPase subunit
MIEVKNITKVFSDKPGVKQVLLNDISFNIPDEKITSIIAPGCSGKSTLLKIISGLENPTSGRIKNSSTFVSIVFIPSLPSSFPWLNVEQNLMVCKKANSNVDVSPFVNIVGLEGYEKYRPHNSSIGFRFRISLARALAQNPSLIVLDDPLKSVEQESRKELYQLVKEINKTTKTAFLIATSDTSEVISLSDIIILMKKDALKIVPIQYNSQTKNIAPDRSEEFLKIKNQIEFFMLSNDSNR